MKYRLLLLIWPLFLACMDIQQVKKRFSLSQENTDHQDPVTVTQGQLIECYREGGKKLFHEKSDKLSKILQDHGISANAVARIARRIETNKFEIFSPRNKDLENILESENVHSDAVSAVVQGVKADDICQEMEIDCT